MHAAAAVWNQPQRFLLLGLLVLRLNPLLFWFPPKGEAPKGVPALGNGEPKPMPGVACGAGVACV
jgi:hypothetical protein